MNKKILSIFVMVMALLLLGVSCNKKTTDPTNDGGSTTTQKTKVKFDGVKAALEAFGTVTGSGNSDTINFSGISVSSGNIALTITSGGNTKVIFPEVQAALKAKLDAISVQNLTITSDIDSVSKPGANKEDLVITLTIKPTDTSKYELDSSSFQAVGCNIVGGQTTLKITLTPGENWADS